MPEAVKLLVVSDDPDFRIALARILENAAHSVRQAAVGEDVPSLVRSFQPALLLLDRPLGDATASELFRRLKHDAGAEDCHVILVYRRAPVDEDTHEVPAFRADGHIVRSVSDFELLTRVETYARVAQLSRELRKQNETIRENAVAAAASQIATLNLMDDALAANERYEQLNRQLKAEVSQRSRATEHLRLTATALDSVSQGVLITGRDHLILSANSAFTAITGYSESEVLGRNCKFLQGPLSDPATIRAIHSNLQRGVEFAGEILNYRKGGSPFWSELTISPVRDAAGAVTHFVGVTRDVTERKHAREKLIETHRLLTKLTQQVPGVVYQYRLYPDGRSAVPYASAGMNDIFELNPMEVQADATPVFDRLHPEDHDRVAAAIHQSARTLETFYCEFRVVLPRQGLRWRWCQAQPERMEDGSTLWYGIISDITARKLAETKLHQLSRIVEKAPLSIAITNLTGVIEYANPTFCAVSGFALEELLGQNPRVLKSGRTPPEVYRAMWETLGRGEVWRGELNNRKKSGELYDELAVIAPVTDDSGKVTHYVALEQDITERKSRESALRESEQRFRELFDLESDAILVLEADTGWIVQANEAALATYGYTLAEFVRLRSIDISAEPEKSTGILESARRDFDQVFKVPFRLHRKRDGTVFPVEISIRTFQRAGQAMLVAVIRDITEQVKTREQLERFNAELEEQVARRTEEIAARNHEIEALLNSIPDLVMRLSRDGALINFQPAKGATPLAGITATPGPASVPSLLDPVLQAALPLGLRALAERTTVASEIEITHDKVSLATELRVAPVGTGEFVVFARDITERKRFDAAMVEMLEKERQISEMKTRFISVTSHEFRTPMAAAMASADLLRNHLNQLTPAKREELFDRIVTSLHRMTHMLDDVLLLNRIDADRVELHPAPLDLWDHVHNVIEEVRLGDRDAHRFELDATGRTSRFLTDANLLHHILSNLLSNAVRYSAAGTVITVRLSGDADEARVAVEDRGIGVPEADRARIFESFERGSNVGTIKGTGLGLNIVKRMTGLLGGTIAFEAPEAGGSRFVLTLPRPADPATNPS